MVKPKKDLLAIQHDITRDYSITRAFMPLFTSAKSELVGLPTNYSVPTPKLNDQESTSYCAPTTVAEAIASSVGVPMSPDWQTALVGKLAGAPIYNGTDPKTAMKSGTLGCLPLALAPYTLAKDGPYTVADWRQWPSELNEQAANFKRASYYSVTAGNPDDYDIFDSIRLALWIAREENAPVMVFGFWYDEWNAPNEKGIVPMPGKPISRHAYLLVGWKVIENKCYLVAQMSEGEDFGDKGFIYISREAINKAFLNYTMYGLGLYIFRAKNPSFWQNSVDAVRKLVGVYSNHPEIVMRQTNLGNALYETTRAALGTDVTPRDEVADNVSCAASVNALFKKATGVEIGGKASTKEMHVALQDIARFTPVPAGQELPGDIIISPTGWTGSILAHGHAGVVLQTGIASVDYRDGILRQNYSRKAWENYFTVYGKIPTLIYRPKDIV